MVVARSGKLSSDRAVPALLNDQEPGTRTTLDLNVVSP